MPKRRPRQVTDDYADATLAGVARQARVATADRDVAIVTLAHNGRRIPQIAVLADMTTGAVQAVLEHAASDRCGHCGEPRAVDLRFGLVTAWLHRPDAAELAGWHDAGRCSA